MNTSRLFTVCIFRSIQLANSMERNSFPCSSSNTTTSPGCKAFRMASPSFFLLLHAEAFGILQFRYHLHIERNIVFGTFHIVIDGCDIMLFDRSADHK